MKLMNSVAAAIVDELSQAGIDRVFGLPGGEVLFFMEALRQKDIPFTLCRHEAYAGIMAAVYGKLKRVPGVVLTTLGPGATNLMLPLANSLLDREPLLAISAQIPTSWPATHTHQRLPLLDSFQPITKFTATLDCFTARRTMRRAIELCLEEPVGPVFLTLSAEDATAPSSHEVIHGPRSPMMEEGTAGLGGLSNVRLVAEELRQRLAQAERPLVILGIGVNPALAGKLRQWLNSWDLPVAVTPKVKGLVDETQANFVGVVGGMAIDWIMLDALHSADLIVGFGFDPVEVDKTWHAERPIVWVLESPLALQVVPHKDLISTRHQALLDQLCSTEPPRQWNDPFADVKRRRNEVYAGESVDELKLSHRPTAIVRTLADVLPPDTIVTTDVGSHKYLFGQFYPSRQPETFFVSNGLSGMGYGLSAAIGAKLARPTVPVLAVLGDGAFSMNCQELETARRIGAPLIVIVLADESYSMIHLSQEARGFPNYGVDFEPIDTVRVAEACGIKATRVETAESLRAVVREAYVEKGSVVVEVPVAIAAYKGIV